MMDGERAPDQPEDQRSPQQERRQRVHMRQRFQDGIVEDPHACVRARHHGSSPGYPSTAGVPRQAAAQPPRTPGAPGRPPGGGNWTSAVVLSCSRSLRIPARFRNSLTPVNGKRFRRRSTAAKSSRNSSTGSTATTEAVRTPPVNNATSPKTAPTSSTVSVRSTPSGPMSNTRTRPESTTYMPLPASPLWTRRSPAPNDSSRPSSTTLRASHCDSPRNRGTVVLRSRFSLSSTMSHSVTSRVEYIRIGVSTSSATIATTMTKADNTPKDLVGTKLENIRIRNPPASASET